MTPLADGSVTLVSFHLGQLAKNVPMLRLLIHGFNSVHTQPSVRLLAIQDIFTMACFAMSA